MNLRELPSMSSVRRGIVLLCAAFGVLGSVILGFLLVGPVFSGTGNNQTPLSYMQGSRIDIAGAETYWRIYIDKNGAIAAQEEFVKQGASIDASQAHVLAHTFGAALYREQGVDGFSVCPDAFIWGCYHQFIGDAISEHGSTVIGTFASDCNKKPSKDMFACLHGIGHGLVGYWGYTLAALTQSLGACRSIDSSNPRAGCADGVFMEYNIHELAALDSDGHLVPRTLSVGERYTPCDTVEDRYRTACVFELPNWWVAAQAPSRTAAERFSLAGAYCKSMDMGTALSEVCIAGVGHIAPVIANLDIEKTVSLCDNATQDSAERQLCLSAAARRFRILRPDEDLTRLCARFGLSDEALASCATYARSDPSK